MSRPGASQASTPVPMARRVGVRALGGSPAAVRLPQSLFGASRRVAIGFGLAALALVATLGSFARQVSANSDPTPSPAASLGTGTLTDSWGAGMGTASLDLFDLTWKGILVLVLLFVTLRVLGRMQGPGRARTGNLNVLESRQLAAKASLHLVAVGERRLVVGLTPAGMVAIAELGADELPVEELLEPEGDATQAATGRPGALGPAIAPIDAFAARLSAAFRREYRR